MLRVRRILCAVDFSAPSREAMHYAVELARRFGADLTLFHAYTYPGYVLPEGALAAGPEIVEQIRREVDRALASWRSEAEERGAANVATLTAHGAAADEIQRAAREGRYDLIVVGTHGRTGVKHALLGSVAERVVRRAPCPVLTVRTGDHRLEAEPEEPRV